MPETLVRVSALVKEYGERTVLDVEALDIYQGEVLALVGPSGAGKSTLLRLLNLIEPPTRGEILFRGQAMGAGPPPIALRRQVTTVFQRPVLLNADVYSNVAYGLNLRHARVNGRATEILARVGLLPLARTRALALSGGEMQRVALARALVIDPALLLLDEPTANLDPYNVALIEDIVREQNRTKGTTIVLVTHNIFQAKRLAHRVGLMLGGRLIQVLDTQTFFNSPVDPRTAAFVRGEMVY